MRVSEEASLDHEGGRTFMGGGGGGAGGRGGRTIGILLSLLSLPSDDVQHSLQHPSLINIRGRLFPALAVGLLTMHPFRDGAPFLL